MLSSNAPAGGVVTLEGFREYYRDVGVCEPYDTVFVPMVEVRVENAGALDIAFEHLLFLGLVKSCTYESTATVCLSSFQLYRRYIRRRVRRVSHGAHLIRRSDSEAVIYLSRWNM